MTQNWDGVLTTSPSFLSRPRRRSTQRSSRVPQNIDASSQGAGHAPDTQGRWQGSGLRHTARRRAAGKLSLCVSGAGPLHRPIQEAFESRTDARIVEGYGLTEASPVVSAGPFWAGRTRRKRRSA
ncbi:AMP-binding protein [Planctomycetota bacterium]